MKDTNMAQPPTKIILSSETTIYELDDDQEIQFRLRVGDFFKVKYSGKVWTKKATISQITIRKNGEVFYRGDEPDEIPRAACIDGGINLVIKFDRDHIVAVKPCITDNEWVIMRLTEIRLLAGNKTPMASIASLRDTSMTPPTTWTVDLSTVSHLWGASEQLCAGVSVDEIVAQRVGQTTHNLKPVPPCKYGQLEREIALIEAIKNANCLIGALTDLYTKGPHHESESNAESKATPLAVFTEQVKALWTSTMRIEDMYQVKDPVSELTDEQLLESGLDFDRRKRATLEHRLITQAFTVV